MTLRSVVLLWFAVAASVAVAAHQPADDAIEAQLAEVLAERDKGQAESARLGGRAEVALREGDLDLATDLLLQQIELDPDNFVPRYNLACVFSVQDRSDEAATMLRRAVELGFISKAQLERDPWLSNLRRTAFYDRLIENWPAVIEARRDAQVSAVRRWLDGPVERTVAEDLRLDVLSHYDPRSTEMAIDDLRRVARWAGSMAPEYFTLREDDPWAVVVLPEERDFLKWAVATFGARARRANAGIGGAYEHDKQRLVANDLGPTLRHEFMHVLHWRAMERTGQRHPIWIQEGIASLVEDLDPVPGRADTLRPAPSRRTNVVKRLAKANRLPTLEELAGLTHQVFSTRRPLAQYAQARTLFLYLDDRGLLDDWLRVYTADDTHGFAADATGLLALDHATGIAREDAQRAYKVWVATELEEAPDRPTDVDAQLGVALEPGEGDGPRIRSVPGSVRRATGLRIGDVVTSIDGRPVRGTDELLRIMAGYRPGQTATLTYRRGKLHGETEIRLQRVP